MTPTSLHFVHYIPIATTLLSAIFAAILFRRYALKRTGPHLLWWGFGMISYGLGTGLESAVTLFGNSVALTKAWYIAGALLGGYPLAQGSVYLLLKRRLANVLTAITVPFIVIFSLLVVLSPANLDALESFRPGGAVLGWSWIRLFTPIINSYAVLFLVGGAFLSAWRYWKSRAPGHGQRAIGNVFIAVGGILPGIGGIMAKSGMVEGLYIGEFAGLLLMWAGFAFNIRAKLPAAPPAMAVPAKA